MELVRVKAWMDWVKERTEVEELEMLKQVNIAPSRRIAANEREMGNNLRK